jgi:ankyrin repeat protein
LAGDTALLLACRKLDTRMMELLLKNGADVNLANHKKQSPLHAVLHTATGYPYATIPSMPHVHTISRYSLFLLMSSSDPIASVSLLCDVEGIIIDNPDSSGHTPLALAAQKGAVMSSLCLLNHGANIDSADNLVCEFYFVLISFLVHEITINHFHK